MYAVYTYAAGSTTANIVNDVAAILTGTTDKTTLSAACVQANTSILTDYDTAGWAMHDSAAAASQVVIKAPVSDNSGQYKYCLLDAGSQANAIGTTAYESWNATTHIGTNYADQPRSAGSKATAWQKLSTTAGGTIYISANPKRILFASLVSAAWGASNVWCGIAERTRDMPWDTVANGYIPMAWIGSYGYNSSGNFSQPMRFRSNTTGADINNAYFGTTIPLKPVNVSMTTGSYAPPASKILNAFGVSSYLVMPAILAEVSTYSYMGSNISSVSDVWQLQPGFGAMLDELTMNGKTYVVWNNYYTNNASGSLLVPKG